MKTSYYLMVLLIAYGIVMTLAFTSTKDQLSESRKRLQVDTVYVEKVKPLATDTCFLDTTYRHGRTVRDTMVCKITIKTDTVKKFYWKW